MDMETEWLGKQTVDKLVYRALFVNYGEGRGGEI
jgi:hypothetical protein